MKLGNGRWETAKFNNRMQVTELGLGASASDAGSWKTQYEYGDLNSNGTVDANKNTGNIAKQTLSFNGIAHPLVQSYKYDALYRITEATETSNSVANWFQAWGYDRYGNRTSFTQNIGGNPSSVNPTIDVNTNRFNAGQGFGYDKNGNVTSNVDPITSQARTFLFNGDNKQFEVKDVNGTTTARYYYDGEGKRVKKKNEVTGEVTIFVYSSGKLVAEYSTATPPATPTVNYTTTDHLGSPRVITDAVGQVSSRRDFLPFGEEVTINVGARSTALKYGSSDDKVRQKFTGYQKDTETSLDFAEARMYDNRFGRFTAVDPLLASGKSANPQTFNRFVYVGNSPLAITDPQGLDWYRQRMDGLEDRYRYEWYDQNPGDDWEAVSFRLGQPYLQVDGWRDNGVDVGTVYLNKFSSTVLKHSEYGTQMSIMMAAQSAIGFGNEYGIGHGKGFYNFGATTLNLPVTMPILPFAAPIADTSIGGMFGISPPVPRADYYGALQNTFGYGTEGALTVASIARGVASLRAGASVTQTFPTSAVAPEALNGAKLSNISAANATRIQDVANAKGVEITLFGSRARGTAHAGSDWDYIINANAKIRNFAEWKLPKGPANSGRGRIDVLKQPLPEWANFNLQPQIIFRPN